jgi:hypothetical protein
MKRWLCGALCPRQKLHAVAGPCCSELGDRVDGNTASLRASRPGHGWTLLSFTVAKVRVDSPRRAQPGFEEEASLYERGVVVTRVSPVAVAVQACPIEDEWRRRRNRLSSAAEACSDRRRPQEKRPLARAFPGSLYFDGCVVIENVVDVNQIEDTRAALYRAQARIEADVGAERLRASPELGVLRLAAVRAVFLQAARVTGGACRRGRLRGRHGDSAPAKRAHPASRARRRTCRRLPNALPPRLSTARQPLRDVREYLRGNRRVPEGNGATLVVPGTHRLEPVPATPALCPAGSLIPFDPTLLHAAGQNHSERDRCAINQQLFGWYRSGQS